MPDNITFNTIPIDIRTPGVFAEVDHTKAVSGLANMPRRILVIGNKLAAGSAVAGQLYRINAPGEAAGLFGRGSVLHEMLTKMRGANKETDMWACGLADAGGGTAATYTVTITGPATAAGSLYLYLNGERLTIGVASGDTATQIATAIAAAVNAYADGPFTAGSTLGVATLTARHKGVFGNDLTISANYQPDEKLPAGITFVVAVGVAGAGNPDVATALASIAQEAFYTIVTPWNDATNVGKVETELASRWGGMDMRAGHVFLGYTGTHGALTTYGSARNSAHSTVIGCKNTPHPSYLYAGVLAAVCEFSGAIDPARPFTTLALPGLLPPAQADRFTRQEQDLLLRDGISTFNVDQGSNVTIQEVVTTYQVNAYGIEDVSLLKLNSKWTADYMRFAFRVDVALAFPRHKLADDGTNFDQGQPVATPLLIRSVNIATARNLEKAGLLEDFEDFKKNLVVVRSLASRDRVNAIWPPNLVNQFSVLAAALQYRL
ncbi:MAG: phage tail sheath subtilisin-like domain-containing protein [Burkholderiales bacterium]|nr:phage tail sheath subtilisin-like domain-containing protein [Burkholderiales bacterium]